MSFEGYYQKMCKNGHAWETDVYVDDDACSECGLASVWSHMVDETNGEGRPIKLRKKSIKKCKTCGHIQEIKYYIPGSESK